MQAIILEGDSLQVINDITKDKGNLSSFGMVFSDIKSKLLSFTSWSTHHVKREANSVAHILAKSALLVTDITVNKEQCASYIISLL